MCAVGALTRRRRDFLTRPFDTDYFECNGCREILDKPTVDDAEDLDWEEIEAIAAKH